MEWIDDDLETPIQNSKGFLLRGDAALPSSQQFPTAIA